MIETVISYINSQIQVLELFVNRMGLVELIRKENEYFPAEYCSMGEYKEIKTEEATVYHRKTGRTVIREQEEESNGCDLFQCYSTPMKAVIWLKKDILKQKNDDQYIEEKIAHNIINAITTINNIILTSTLKADSVSVSVSGYNTDRYGVWKEEFSVPMPVKFDYMLISVDYDIEICGQASCFENYGCDTNVVPIFCNSVQNLSFQELNDQLTQEQINNIQRRIPLKTGITTSYIAGDDGSLLDGFGVSFNTLSTNNNFGNTDRFTDENGLQVYGSDYVIDHFTGLGWKRTVNNDTLPNLLTAAQALTFAGFSDWRLANINEYFTLLNLEFMATGALNYSPFSLDTGAIGWYSSSLTSATDVLVFVASAGITTVMVNTAFGIARDSLFVRNHF